MASIKNPCPNCGRPAISRSSRQFSSHIGRHLDSNMNIAFKTKQQQTMRRV